MVSTHPSGTVTFLFTDIEGSTRLWEEHPTAMKAALAQHDELVRRAIEAHGGTVIKNTGDGFHAVFGSGLNGVGAVVAMQKAILATPWNEIKPGQIRVRAALHTGESDERAGDYYGPSLNRAARLMSIAHGGQTLLTTATAELVRDQLPEAVSLRDLGEHRLKDLVRSERVFQLSAEGLPSEFPALRSIDAYPNNLPIQLTTFIGRQRELKEARARLAGSRLLTMIGPGGTGKTRLSLQLGAEVLPEFADGVWVAELAAISDPSLIVPTVATVFGLREQQGMGIQGLLMDFLRDKEVLLIVDNCEHLIEAAARLIEQLLHTAPKLKIVASSREALGLGGEQIYRVPSLTLPNELEETAVGLVQCESVQLFMERAAAVNPRIELSQQNAVAVAQIVRRLDGIPLALELAAARVAVLTPEEIASRLDDRFRLLTGGSRTAMPRQQTLRALIDWSYELLSEAERKLFRKFSVFAGGCRYEAVEAICTEMDVLNLLTQLVNKSLVAMEDEDGSSRYRLLETVRQYARDKLVEGGEAEEARNAHFKYFRSMAESAGPLLEGPKAREWLKRLESEHDNLRAAIEWGMENNLGAVLHMIPALERFWNRQGHGEEGRQIVRAALERAEKAPVPAEASARADWIRGVGESMRTQTMLAFNQGDYAKAMEVAERAARFAREHGDRRGLAILLAFGASALMFAGDLDRAAVLLEEAVPAGHESGDKLAEGLSLARYGQYLARRGTQSEAAKRYTEEGTALLQDSEDRWAMAMSFVSLGNGAALRGDYEEARTHFREAGPIFEELGDRHRINMINSELAHLDRHEGNLDQAEAGYRGTILEWKRIGHRSAIAHELECFAMIAAAREHNRRAARLFGAAAALREKIGIAMTAREKVEYDRQLEGVRASLTERTFEEAWSAGKVLGMEEAIDLALDGTEEP